MTLRDLTRTPALRAATTVLGLCGLLFVWAVARALRADALPAATPPSSISLDAVKRAPIRPPVDVQAAVESDVFAPDRSAPSVPYRMPGESASVEKTKVEPMKPSVLGTAVAEDGRSFATLQLGDAPPTLVHVGDRIGDWIVRSIARGKVVLESTEGARAELSVPKPGM